MNLNFIRTSAVTLLVAASSAFAAGASAPKETTSIQIKRTATTANPAVVTLTKNLFKTESYEDNYTVQVPYQAEEIYTVDIPYQVDEQYTVQVPYQVDEQYTEQVPYTVQVPYTDTETTYTNEQQCNNVTRYRNEQQCHTVTNYRNECHSEQRCYIVPGDSGGGCHDVQECGTNALGQQICKTRQVCDSQGSPQQRCDQQQVCNQVPYQDQQCNTVQVPYNDTECHMVQVPHTRQVTKYRDETRYRTETGTRTVTKYRTETRTRTVTKTRTETRTRTVTKYRDEQKCCVTKTRQVFDTQLSFQVTVNFPQDAVLTGKQSETITISLASADATTASVAVAVGKDAIYNYSIANQAVSGAGILVDLAVAPKFDISNAGPSTIKGLLVDYSTTFQKFRITFTDSFVSSQVTSQYTIDINDAATGDLIETVAVGKGDANHKFVTRITKTLDKHSKIVATVKIRRTSAQIANGVLDFTVVGKN